MHIYIYKVICLTTTFENLLFNYKRLKANVNLLVYLSFCLLIFQKKKCFWKIKHVRNMKLININRKFYISAHLFLRLYICSLLYQITQNPSKNNIIQRYMSMNMYISNIGICACMHCLNSGSVGPSRHENGADIYIYICISCFPNLKKLLNLAL